MRAAPFIAPFVGVLVLGTLWTTLSGRDDTTAKVRAARERAERVRANGELPWESPDWQKEFEWLHPDLGVGTSEAASTLAAGPREASAPVGPSVTCELTVLGADGRVLANCPVALRSVEGNVRAVPRQPRTDANGRVRVSAPAGSYRLLTYEGEARFSLSPDLGELEITISEPR